MGKPATASAKIPTCNHEFVNLAMSRDGIHRINGFVAMEEKSIKRVNVYFRPKALVKQGSTVQNDSEG